MSSDGKACSTRSLDLLKAQIRAIDAWNGAHHAGEAAAARTTSMSREMRLDLSRRMDARRREHAAIVARVDAQLRMSGDVLHRNVVRRAVVAHRNEWMTQKITALLTDRQVQVIGTFVDGAEAAGTAIAEQPDLVIVEDRLSTLTGTDVVREVREYSPQSVVAAQVLDSTGVARLVDAGAHAVFTRRIRPADVVDQVLHCLQCDADSRRPLTVV